MIPFGKIEQFRNIARTMKHLNTNGEYESLEFEGTVKLHGTNAAVGIKDGELYYQSRSNILRPGLEDNFGFAGEQVKNAGAWVEFFSELSVEDCIVHGEWCGRGIQRVVAISELDRMFVIFKLTVNGQDTPLSKLPALSMQNVCTITDFPTYRIKIDSEFPEKAVSELCAITEAVETECPVGKQFGVSGVGEGVVWKCTDPSLRSLIFKVKGKKHSVSKVKTLAAVDPETVASIEEFVCYAATENRMNQGIQEVGLGQSLFREFIKWVMNDIISEESDVLAANGLTLKQVSKALSVRARKFYMAKLEVV